MMITYGGVCPILKDVCVIFYFKVYTHQRFSEVDELMNQGVYYNGNLILIKGRGDSANSGTIK